MQRSLKLLAALCASAPVIAQQASKGNWTVRARTVSPDFDPMLYGIGIGYRF